MDGLCRDITNPQQQQQQQEGKAQHKVQKKQPAVLKANIEWTVNYSVVQLTITKTKIQLQPGEITITKTKM